MATETTQQHRSLTSETPSESSITSDATTQQHKRLTSSSETTFASFLTSDATTRQHGSSTSEPPLETSQHGMFTSTNSQTEDVTTTDIAYMISSENPVETSSYPFRQTTKMYTVAETSSPENGTVGDVTSVSVNQPISTDTVVTTDNCTTDDIGNNPGNDGLNAGVLIGITVAIVIVIALVLTIVIVICIVNYKKRRLQRSNTPRNRKISTGVKRPAGFDSIDRRMIQHPVHMRKDSVDSFEIRQNIPPQSIQDINNKGNCDIYELNEVNNSLNSSSTSMEVKTPISNQQQNMDNEHCNSDDMEPGDRFGAMTPTYLQKTSMGYVKQPRKLSGPNNKVPTNLLSDWKKKYGVAQGGISEDANEEQEEDQEEEEEKEEDVEEEGDELTEEMEDQFDEDITKSKTVSGNTDESNIDTDNSNSDTFSTDVTPTHLQQHSLGYKKQPRKLSGPNNQVPKNLLSDWKNKYGIQQGGICEEEDEEGEEEDEMAC